MGMDLEVFQRSVPQVRCIRPPLRDRKVNIMSSQYFSTIVNSHSRLRTLRGRLLGNDIVFQQLPRCVRFDSSVVNDHPHTFSSSIARLDWLSTTG